MKCLELSVYGDDGWGLSFGESCGAVPQDEGHTEGHRPASVTQDEAGKPAAGAA